MCAFTEMQPQIAPAKRKPKNIDSTILPFAWEVRSLTSYFDSQVASMSTISTEQILSTDDFVLITLGNGEAYDKTTRKRPM